MFRFLTDNSLTLLNQSRFKPRVSCINQLISITHDTYNSFHTHNIYNSFHKDHEVRGVF